jgi:hypothetical protein
VEEEFVDAVAAGGNLVANKDGDMCATEEVRREGVRREGVKLGEAVGMVDEEVDDEFGGKLTAEKEGDPIEFVRERPTFPTFSSLL